MPEKLQFKWDNFQSTVSHTFVELRREEDLFDVTLVTEDEVQMSAHKLILSASSSFFKSILRKNSHSHPLIYLSGVTSSNLLQVLDYVYQGEVQLREDQVESFLSVSSKLKISGMVLDRKSSKTEESESSQTKADSETNILPQSDSDSKSKLDLKTETVITADMIKQVQIKANQKKDNLKTDIVYVELDEDDSQNKLEVSDFSKPELKPYGDKFYFTDVKEADIKILELTGRAQSGAFQCNICNYISSQKSCVMKHIENRHIEGLSFYCEFCDKTFKNRNQLGNHRSRFHSRKLLAQ